MREFAFQDASATPVAPAGFQIQLRWRLLIYFALWVVAAAILATCSELYLDDDRTETSERWRVFAMAPIVVSMGLDFATLSAFQCATGQVGLFTPLFAMAIVSHGLFTFSCARRGSFLALICILIASLSIGVFYALRYYHLDATFAHG